MTKIQIRKVNGVPMGRPKNPFSKYPKSPVHRQWYDFEQSVTEHECPGCEEGEAEGELQWRAKIFGDKEWELMPIDHEPINAMGVINQLIWIVPTPEKVEVKPVRKVQMIPLTDSKLAEITYPSNITIQDIRIIQKAIEIIELASPPTH